MLLYGLHIPLTTPFHPDGRLHPHKLAANVLRYSKSPAAGLIALAPHAGEPTLLTDTETAEVLRTVAEAAAPEKVLLANISRDSLSASLALIHVAGQVGYDAAIVAPPSILAAPSDGSSAPAQPNVTALLTWFRSLADASPLPIALWRAGASRLPLATIAELARHRNIRGLIDGPTDDPTDASEISAIASATTQIRHEVTVTMTFASATIRMLRAASAATTPTSQPAALVSATELARNPASAATAVAVPPAASPLRTRTRTVGFQLLATAPDTMLSSLRNGAAGVAPAFAACAPQACYEVYAAWKDGDQPLAEEKQQRLASTAVFAQTLGPTALKFGCDLNGYYGGPARLPHLPLSASERAELQHRMQSLRT